MAKEKVTGRELRERLRKLSADQLLHFVLVTLREAIPVLEKQPQDEEWSGPTALVFLCEELARRYSVYANLEDLANGLFEKLQDEVLTELSKKTPDKDKV